MLDFFEHGEREVVETVCLVIFPLFSLMKDQVSSVNNKGVKAVVLEPESHCHCILLRDKLVTNVVIRATMCFNLQCNNVARQVEEKCCPYYRTFRDRL